MTPSTHRGYEPQNREERKEHRKKLLAEPLVNFSTIVGGDKPRPYGTYCRGGFYTLPADPIGFRIRNKYGFLQDAQRLTANGDLRSLGALCVFAVRKLEHQPGTLTHEGALP